MPVSPSAQPLNGTDHRFVRVDDGRALPVTVKILLEGVRRVAGDSEQKAAEALARYPRDNATVPFRPSRILLQDYTGVPAAVDLAAMRAAMQRAGICHQVNLERLAQVAVVRDGVAMPDTLFGADSHTTMVNGLGVLGWGVGGIEAEAAMLGQPTYLPWPVVVGVKLKGQLPVGTT